jgi:hypothetical protein
VSREEIQAYADAGARALDLTLSAESRAAVIANLVTLFERAAEFADIPLADGLDPVGLLRL